MSAVVAAGSVFCGCQVNVVSLEVLVGSNPNVGYGLTFLQFLFVSLCSLPLVFSFRERKFRPRQLDAKLLALMCVLFFLTSALNNAVFAFKVSMPIHTTFRSSSLVVNILLGVGFFGRKYSAWQLVCAALITVGIILLTLESHKRSVASEVLPTAEQEIIVGESASKGFFTAGSQLAGLVVLTLTVMLSTILGLVQDTMMAKAKHHRIVVPPGSLPPPRIWAESLFFAHFATAPLFLLRPTQLEAEVRALTSSMDTVQLLLINLITQFLCVCGVYQLADKTSSFTVTLVLTLRKFMSVTFSVFYFGHANTLGVLDWVAIVIVAVGGLAYPFVPKYEVVGASPQSPKSTSAQQRTREAETKKQQ